MTGQVRPVSLHVPRRPAPGRVLIRHRSVPHTVEVDWAEYVNEYQQCGYVEVTRPSLFEQPGAAW